MAFTSPFGNIIEPDFNPNSSQPPQNQKAKAMAQPSPSHHSSAKNPDYKLSKNSKFD